MGMANPSGATYKIYLIAGEPSGEHWGTANGGVSVNFSVGFQVLRHRRTKNASLGLASIFPMSDIALMGIFEILPKVLKLLSRLNETVRTWRPGN